MLKFDMSRQYKGTGVSHGLDRGLLVYSDDVLLFRKAWGWAPVPSKRMVTRISRL
jgi:hypothetical protein